MLLSESWEASICCARLTRLSVTPGHVNSHAGPPKSCIVLYMAPYTVDVVNPKHWQPQLLWTHVPWPLHAANDPLAIGEFELRMTDKS